MSRSVRSVELRITDIDLDDEAESILAEDTDQVIRLIARDPDKSDTVELLDLADAQARYDHNLDSDENMIFFEVVRSDASEFSKTLCVLGRTVGHHRILSAKSPVVANSIAGLLVYIEKRTQHSPHVYFHWTEGSPVTNLFRFLFLGEGAIAPLTQEVLRRAVRDPKHRPVVHVS